MIRPAFARMRLHIMQGLCGIVQHAYVQHSCDGAGECAPLAHTTRALCKLPAPWLTYQYTLSWGAETFLRRPLCDDGWRKICPSKLKFMENIRCQ